MRADLRTKALPVIVVTGSAHETDLMRSYALAAKFAWKPLVFDAFLSTMRKLGLLAHLHFAGMALAMS